MQIQDSIAVSSSTARLRPAPFKGNALAVLAAALLLVGPLAAQSKPDFSGSWKMNKAESKPDPEGPKELAFTIEHKEPAFKYHATGEDSEGAPFEESGDFKIDGKEYPGPASFTIAAHWEGVVLVARIGPSDAPVQIVSLRLSADGKRLTRDVANKEGGETIAHQVFDKQ